MSSQLPSTTIVAFSVLFSFAACGGTVSGPATNLETATDSSSSGAPRTDAGATDGAAATSDSAAKDARAPDLGVMLPTCGTAATAGACVMCCRLPEAPNYGGFELYGDTLCNACDAVCRGQSPCGTNVTPPAGSACVACLQQQLALNTPADCQRDVGCAQFTACLKSCPVR
jgi:hypothetical protein